MRRCDMKKILVICSLIILLIPALIWAQEKTLITGEIESGGYGGPVLKLVSIKGQTSLLLGGYGGWIINHRFVVGGGGYGLVNDVRVEGNQLGLGYGGLILEYVGLWDRMIHFTVPVLIGYGNADYNSKVNDGFFALEPGLNAELNVIRWFRIDAGIGYLFVSGIDNLPGLGSNDVGGLQGTLAFKFGKF
jgi:hypothetical protein